MRLNKMRVRGALVAVLALAVAATAGVATAHAAKVTEKAAGGVLPDQVDVGSVDVQTAFTQEFKLKGKNVKGKQILDVNVIVNSSSPDLDANEAIDAVLVGPKGNNEVLNIPGDGQNLVNVKFDDQSELFECNPLTFQRRDCNYLQGANPAGTAGTVTGSLNDFLNPIFKGGNPKGTWKLHVFDTDSGTPAISWGTATLEVKTGKKFAKV